MSILLQAVNDLMTDFEKVNITMKASVTFRGTGDDLKVKMKELKVNINNLLTIADRKRSELINQFPL